MFRPHDQTASRTIMRDSSLRPQRSSTSGTLLTSSAHRTLRETQHVVQSKQFTIYFALEESLNKLSPTVQFLSFALRAREQSKFLRCVSYSHECLIKFYSVAAVDRSTENITSWMNKIDENTKLTDLFAKKFRSMTYSLAVPFPKTAQISREFL